MFKKEENRGHDNNGKLIRAFMRLNVIGYRIIHENSLCFLLNLLTGALKTSDVKSTLKFFLIGNFCITHSIIASYKGSVTQSIA